MLSEETWLLKASLKIKSTIFVTWFTMEKSVNQGMLEWNTSLTPQFVLYLHLQRRVEEHIWTPANPRGTMKNAVSHTYLCYSEMWRLQALDSANFMILTPVVNVLVHKEVFPRVG